MERSKKSTNPADLFCKFARNGLVEAAIASGNDVVRTFKGVAIATAIVAVPAFGIQTLEILPQFASVVQDLEKPKTGHASERFLSKTEWMEKSRKMPEHANMVSMLQTEIGRHPTDKDFIDVFRSIPFEDMKFLGPDQVRQLYGLKEAKSGRDFHIPFELVYSEFFESWFQSRPTKDSSDDYKAWDRLMKENLAEIEAARRTAGESSKKESGNFVDDISNWLKGASKTENPAPKI
jgi:hypothetical protein